MTAPEEERARGGVVGSYYRMARWEVPPEGGDGTAEAGDGGSVMGARLVIGELQRSAAGGLVAGGLLTAADSLSGMLSGFAVLPEWIVTTNLLLRCGPLRHAGPLRLSCAVLRRGRNAVIGGVVACDEGAGDAVVATCLTTMAVLHPEDLRLRFDRPVRMPLPPPPEQPEGPEEFFCIEPGSGPVTRLALDAKLRNPWGILHGGGMATLVDVAARRAVAAGSPPGEDPVTADAALHYLSPARVGPVEARCRIVATGAGSSVVRISVHDLGADGRRVALATATVRSASDADESHPAGWGQGEAR